MKIPLRSSQSRKSLAKVKFSCESRVRPRISAYDDVCVSAGPELVDRGVDQAQVVENAASREQALARLRSLVVDDVNPLVVIVRQLAPRVAAQDGRGALRGGR